MRIWEMRIWKAQSFVSVGRPLSDWSAGPVRRPRCVGNLPRPNAWRTCLLNLDAAVLGKYTRPLLDVVYLFQFLFTFNFPPDSVYVIFQLIA
jgi:hypothetical protein